MGPGPAVGGLEGRAEQLISEVKNRHTTLLLNESVRPQDSYQQAECHRECWETRICKAVS